MSQVQYVPFISSIDPSFWSQLNTQKLDVLKLDERPLPLSAFYTNDCKAGLPSHLTLSYNSFNVDHRPKQGVPYYGQILNTNTIEDFKAKDFPGVLNTSGLKVWESIKDGRALGDPFLLNYFHVLCFADLKKYKYNYWFNFPALATSATLISQSTVGEKFNSEQQSQLYQLCDQGVVFLNEDLSEIEGVSDKIHKQKYIVVPDPSTDTSHPGWPVRNVLALVAYNIDDKTQINVICLRENKISGQQSIAHSLFLQIELEPYTNKTELPKVVGWERNTKGKLSPKHADLSSTMDPAKISETSVNLNLKLMRWRLLPELDLEILQRLKVLVLGSGTLGCNVARCLLGWGVKSITMLDNGTVSYSNPVRQSLFNFEDCGQPKAEVAAQRIQQINPSAEARAVTLSIPMPGHPVSSLEVDRVKQNIEQLEDLVDNADVVFLLTDTRESRWFPTLLCSAKHKICINSALGFDTYLVMRHGVKGDGEVLGTPLIGAKTVAGTQLGCYFCNDVVAPGDSTKDRTLDQMCTVTRPGNAYVAASLAVELMVSILQHPLKGHAPASMDPMDESCDSCIGRIPHQIRGFLAHFTSVQPTSHAFDKCTACCKEVIDRYRSDKFGFLMDVFNNVGYLEKISGLHDMIDNTDFGDIWEFDSDIDSS